MTAAITYIRVSRPRQGRSGLGLEAQHEAIARFAEAHGFRIAETFSEVETAKGADALDRFRRLFVSWYGPIRSNYRYCHRGG